MNERQALGAKLFLVCVWLLICIYALHINGLIFLLPCAVFGYWFLGKLFILLGVH